MRKMRSHKVGIVAVSLFLSMVCGAEEGMPSVEMERPNQGRFSVGVFIPYQSIAGDFKGDSLFSNPDEAVIVPKIDDAAGIGVLLGFRRKSSRPVDPGVVFSFMASRHDADWLGDTGKVKYAALGAQGKFFFNRPSSPASQPYLSLGLLVPTVVVEEGAVTTSGVYGDGWFYGLGYTLGAGFDFEIKDRVVLDLGFTYQALTFDRLKGVLDKVGKINPKLKSNNFVPAITLAIYLN